MSSKDRFAFGKIALGTSLTSTLLTVLHIILTVVFIVLTPAIVIGSYLVPALGIMGGSMIFSTEETAFVVIAILSAWILLVSLCYVFALWSIWNIIPVIYSTLALATSVTSIVFGIIGLAKNKRDRRAIFNLIVGIATALWNFAGTVLSILCFYVVTITVIYVMFLTIAFMAFGF